MRDYIQGRGKLIRDNAAHTGKWNWVHAIDETVISAMTCAIEGNWSGVTIRAGDQFRVDATSITLTSGTLVAYSE